MPRPTGLGGIPGLEGDFIPPGEGGGEKKPEEEPEQQQQPHNNRFFHRFRHMHHFAKPVPKVSGVHLNCIVTKKNFFCCVVPSELITCLDQI